MITQSTPQWEVTRSNQPGRPSSCFPAGFDTSNLKDISSVCDVWAKYINVTTGETVDCAKFAALMQEQR